MATSYVLLAQLHFKEHRKLFFVYLEAKFDPNNTKNLA